LSRSASAETPSCPTIRSPNRFLDKKPKKNRADSGAKLIVQQQLISPANWRELGCFIPTLSIEIHF
jgi:hypothetical protein